MNRIAASPTAMPPQMMPAIALPLPPTEPPEALTRLRAVTPNTIARMPRITDARPPTPQQHPSGSRTREMMPSTIAGIAPWASGRT